MPQNKTGARRRRRQGLCERVSASAVFYLSMIFSENRLPLFRIVLQELAFKTVTARRFCDQHEMSLHTATGRSLP